MIPITGAYLLTAP